MNPADNRVRIGDARVRGPQETTDLDGCQPTRTGRYVIPLVWKSASAVVSQVCKTNTERRSYDMDPGRKISQFQTVVSNSFFKKFRKSLFRNFFSKTNTEQRSYDMDPGRKNFTVSKSFFKQFRERLFGVLFNVSLNFQTHRLIILV